MLITFMQIAPSGLMQGLILALLVTGIMIPFKLLNFPDLSAEGSYPLGAALCASLIVAGFNPLVALLLAAIAGGIVGVCTAALYLRYKVNSLLAGIILSTMIYSINLRLMGKPNLALFESITLFSSIADGFAWKIVVLLATNLLALLALHLFLISGKGLRFRAAGLNPQFAERQGVNLGANIILGLFIGNALCGLSGALLVQIQSYADIAIGVGIVIHGLAALMIGEKLIAPDNVARQILAPFIGSLIYQQIQGLALSAGLAPSDLKLLTGIIVLSVIALPKRAEN